MESITFISCFDLQSDDDDDGDDSDGLDRVDALTTTIVGLLDLKGFVIPQAVETALIQQWQQLKQVDKDRVAYAARHQDVLSKGRFRSPKKRATFVSGADTSAR